MITTDEALKQMAEFGNEQRRLFIDAQSGKYRVALVTNGEYTYLTGEFDHSYLAQIVSHAVVEMRVAESNPTTPHPLLHAVHLQQWAADNAVDLLAEWTALDGDNGNFWHWLSNHHAKIYNLFFEELTGLLENG